MKPPAEARGDPDMTPQRRVLIVILVVALFAAWRAGTFDHALVNVGLNAHDCARNGFGATYCGKELDKYRQNVQQPIQHAVDQAQSDENAALKQVTDAEKSAQDYQDCLSMFAGDPTAQATCQP
jgi:hypothetical protein